MDFAYDYFNIRKKKTMEAVAPWNGKKTNKQTGCLDKVCPVLIWEKKKNDCMGWTELKCLFHLIQEVFYN